VNPTEHHDERDQVTSDIHSLRATLNATTKAHAQTSEDLRQSEERFRLLVQSIEDYAIFMLDPAGYVVSWNPGAEKIKGYREEEILGKHFAVFYRSEDRTQGQPMRGLEIAAREGIYRDAGWRIRKDGTQFWAEVAIAALRDDEGRLVGYGKVTRDLTERKQTDEILRQSEERFRGMIESIEDYAIFMLDPSGHVVSWNRGAQRLKGYTEAEVIGQHFSIFYPPEDSANHLPERLLRRAAEEGRTEHEGWRVRKDGTRFWADVVITALHDHGGNLVGFVKVTRDLTERRRATEERIHLAQERSARQTAEESVRMRDEFLSVAAHELKTPVTSLLLQTQLMARRLNRTGTLDAEATKRAIAMVEEQTQKISDLVNRLLDVSRVANGRLALERSDASIGRLVFGAVERSRLLAPNRRFDLVAPETLIANVDAMRLEQVVTNLLDNAVKYSVEGPIEVTVSQPDPTRVRIVVRDYGPGVPEAKRSSLFDQFYQAEARSHQGGMGLGLYISEQIVQLHGGELTAEFPPEGGSEFVVNLPRDPLPGKPETP